MLARRFLYTLGGCLSFSAEVRAEQPPGPTIVEYAGRAREAAGQRRSSGLVVGQPPLRKKAADDGESISPNGSNGSAEQAPENTPAAS